MLASSDTLALITDSTDYLKVKLIHMILSDASILENFHTLFL